MCVIFIANEVRPTPEMVYKGWAANPDGGGIAWREGDYVRWKKGVMELEPFAKLIEETPLPFIAHFRIPSQGGKKESLCHPFPIDKKVPLNLEGRTKGNVLFHNGHWNAWRATGMDAALKSGVSIPIGKWSDSRAMAFVASIYGPGILEFIDEKAVVFGPDVCEVFSGASWKEENGVWCSNDYWKNRSYNTNTHNHTVRTVAQMCKETSCSKDKYSTYDYCFEHKELDPNYKDFQNRISGGAAKDALLGVNDGNKSNDPQKKVEGPTSDVISLTDRGLAYGGALLKKLPFSTINMLYRSGRISRKQWKKGQARAGRAGKKFQRIMARGAVKKFHEMDQAPILIKH